MEIDIEMQRKVDRFIQRYRAPGYNVPQQPAMFVSQWAHQLFLWGFWSYDTYVMVQRLAYHLLYREPTQGEVQE